jgi:hypothetical protein
MRLTGNAADIALYIDYQVQVNNQRYDMTDLQDMYCKSLHMRTSMKAYAIGNISIPNSLIGQE